MNKQPHLDHRAIHPFYGSQIHYIILLLLSLPLLYSIFSFFRELFYILKSQVVDASIYYNLTSLARSGENNTPVLSFTDPDYGEQRYVVNDPNLLSLIQNNPELSNIAIRYNIEKSGNIAYLHINSFLGVWGEALAYLLLSIVLILLMVQLSPGPPWYWKHIDRRLEFLSNQYYQIEIHVKQFENVGTVFATGHRVCRLYGDVYIHTQNVFIEIQSPKFLVEPEFRMSYPILDVYLNLKKPKRYELDLKKFLKQNASTLYGYTENDREYAHSQSHKVS